jgi:small subunit ribosomal protein S5|tara:strand:+ start:10448 stop:10936 length:489 start_codon:yes stop_codon:yes gene_type:complete
MVVSNSQASSKISKEAGSSRKWKKQVVNIRRVTKVVKGGKKLQFAAIVVIGNENGYVGLGLGKANDVSDAVRKASHNGKRHIINVPLTSNKSIPHFVQGQFGAAKVLIKPASSGSGVIAGGSVRIILELVGLQNVMAKQLGCNNALNNARATFMALESLKSA